MMAALPAQVAMLKACVNELRHELTAARSVAAAEQQRSSSEGALRLEAEARLAELQCATPCSGAGTSLLLRVPACARACLSSPMMCSPSPHGCGPPHSNSAMAMLRLSA